MRIRGPGRPSSGGGESRNLLNSRGQPTPLAIPVGGRDARRRRLRMGRGIGGDPWLSVSKRDGRPQRSVYRSGPHSAPPPSDATHSEPSLRGRFTWRPRGGASRRRPRRSVARSPGRSRSSSTSPLCRGLPRPRAFPWPESPCGVMVGRAPAAHFFSSGRPGASMRAVSTFQEPAHVQPNG